MFFFFNDTATTEIYTLSLHDALPIYLQHPGMVLEGELRFLLVVNVLRRAVPEHDRARLVPSGRRAGPAPAIAAVDRKSTRLNSSHANISYAVFCLKKKKKSPPIFLL